MRKIQDHHIPKVAKHPIITCTKSWKKEQKIEFLQRVKHQKLTILELILTPKVILKPAQLVYTPCSDIICEIHNIFLQKTNTKKSYNPNWCHFLPRKAKRSLRSIQEPKLSNKSVLCNSPLLQYCRRNCSAKYEANRESCDRIAHDKALPNLPCFSDFMPCTLQIVCTEKKCCLCYIKKGKGTVAKSKENRILHGSWFEKSFQ